MSNKCNDRGQHFVVTHMKEFFETKEIFNENRKTGECILLLRFLNVRKGTGRSATNMFNYRQKNLVFI